MFYVYVLRSRTNSEKIYVGYTNNLKRRLREHNAGESEYTRQFGPWKVEVYVAFRCEKKAKEFERYLKSGGGWRFAKRRLV